jgi:hypothetical protein
MARRFPAVPLIMAHCGFFWQWELAAELAIENKNLYLETSRVPPFESGKILEKISPNKMIWGTDGPFADYEREYEKIKHITKGNEEVFNMIIGGNILNLLKMDLN